MGSSPAALLGAKVGLWVVWVIGLGKARPEEESGPGQPRRLLSH